MPAPTLAAGDLKIKPLNFSEGNGNTKVKKPLDSKANNWSLWAQDIYLIFDFMKAIGYVEGKIPCPNAALYPESAENWHQNDTYAKMLINKNIIDNKKMHTRKCATAHHMWNNLKSIYENTSYLVFTDQLSTLFVMKAMEDTNIPEHLAKLKHLWDKLTLFSKQNKLLSDALFKRIIAASLPHSWNMITNPYVQGWIDEPDTDPKKRIDSQQLISIIKQEWELNKSRKNKELVTTQQSDNSQSTNKSSLASRISNPSNRNRTPRAK